nr:hypothetical protein [Tanacetum cinerariifolium]
GIIAEIDADKDVILAEVDPAKDAEVGKDADVQGRLKESPAQVYHIDLEHVDKVLSMQDDEPKPAELKEVIEVVTTTKLMTEVVIDAATTAVSIIIVAPSAARGMRYDDIRPIFEKHFNFNVAFPEKSEEQLKEKASKALKRTSESSEQQAAKKQKLDEEVEELKKHLQIFPNDEDDVYTEATPLALKMILLVERRYPLRMFTLEQMVNNVRLEVEEESEVSLELLRFVRRQQQEGYRLDTLKKGRDLSAPIDKKRLRAASFSLCLHISFNAQGCSNLVTALIFEGLAFMPYLVIRCPENGPSSTPNEHFFGFSFMLIDQNLSKFMLGLEWFSSTMMVLKIPVMSTCVHAKMSALALRKFCNSFLKCSGNCFSMVTIYSGYLSFIMVFSSVSSHMGILSLLMFMLGLEWFSSTMMVLKIPVMSTCVHAKMSALALRKFCNSFLKCSGNCFSMVTIYSGYLSFIMVFSSVSSHMGILSLLMMHTRASNSKLVEPLPEPERTLNQRRHRQNIRVPYNQRNNPPQHPKIVYLPILDINHFRHFLVTLGNLYLMDDEPMWAANRRSDSRQYYQNLLSWSKRDNPRSSECSAGGIFLYKTPNQAYQLLEDKVLLKLDWAKNQKTKSSLKKTVAFADKGNSNSNTDKIMARMDAMTLKMDTQYKELQTHAKNTKPNLDEDDIPMSHEEEEKFMQNFHKNPFYNDYRERESNCNNWCLNE